MNTDALIEQLSSSLAPLQTGATRRRTTLTIVLGGLGAVAIMLFAFGLNPALRTVVELPEFWLKVVFTGALAVAALPAMLRLARPGGFVGGSKAWIAFAFALMWAVTAFALIAAPSGERAALVLGHTWRTCPLNIALIAAPVFVASVLVMRALAPTRLRTAGAAAGLFSGALGAFVYSWHCPELAAPFIGTWYVLGIAVPTAAGALLGPVWLRW